VIKNTNLSDLARAQMDSREVQSQSSSNDSLTSTTNAQTNNFEADFTAAFSLDPVPVEKISMLLRNYPQQTFAAIQHKDFDIIGTVDRIDLRNMDSDIEISLNHDCPQNIYIRDSLNRINGTIESNTKTRRKWELKDGILDLYTENGGEVYYHHVNPISGRVYENRNPINMNRENVCKERNPYSSHVRFLKASASSITFENIGDYQPIPEGYYHRFYRNGMVYYQ
jgi:hypothetical protein